jgi:hypothetical protein
MKKIVKYYFLELFYCFVIGICCALAKYISAWFVVLMIIPILKSTILMDLIKELEKYPEKACAFIDVTFLALIGALIAGASFLPDGECAAVIFGGWIFCSLLFTIILLYRVHIP